MQYYTYSPIEGLVECDSLEDAEESAQDIIHSIQESGHPEWRDQVEAVYVAVQVKTHKPVESGVEDTGVPTFELRPVDNSETELPWINAPH